MSTQATVASVTNAAVAQSAKNNPSFADNLAYEVRKVAAVKPTLTTDDVWDQYHATWGPSGSPFILTRHQKSAIGPAMMRAVKLGYITQVDGASRKSKRPESHGRLLRVFKSKITN